MSKNKLIACSDCKQEISKNADACPHCGAKNKKTSVVGIIVAIIIGVWIFSALSPDSALNNATMQSITDKVAVDSVEQYNIAKRNGNAIDICVQAGMVKAAYLQAKNDAEYNRWNGIEKQDCTRAGL